ncbi:hypothetical protein GOBAR_AA39221 [Gossypium barbadense]|uniref:Uncharacterized protein n=1 Tax=Gossypium barbadense TaxID=3634 RepID=A0A2P5VRM9_GOSBA|nr:hypothetical protein GOBAR_AA39221 [Gossypium barbadense]
MREMGSHHIKTILISPRLQVRHHQDSQALGFPKKGFRVLSFSSALLHEGDGISSHQDHFDQSAFAGAASSRFASFGKGFSLLPSVLSNGILNLDDAASANVWATFNCK